MTPTEIKKRFIDPNNDQDAWGGIYIEGLDTRTSHVLIISEGEKLPDFEDMRKGPSAGKVIIGINTKNISEWNPHAWYWSDIDQRKHRTIKEIQEYLRPYGRTIEKVIKVTMSSKEKRAMEKIRRSLKHQGTSRGSGKSYGLATTQEVANIKYDPLNINPYLERGVQIELRNGDEMQRIYEGWQRELNSVWGTVPQNENE